MLFNSYQFICFFLPICFVVYFSLNKVKLLVLAKIWLCFSSIFFYTYWNIKYLPLLALSISVNYLIGSALNKSIVNIKYRKTTLIVGILFNVGLLFIYKYTDFIINNINSLTGSSLDLLKLILPLGISFFTFTQIAFIVDNYHGNAKEFNFINYILFVTFFPHLIAGPIIHHKEMMPQFDKLKNKIIQWNNIHSGLFLFSIGLAKKVLIADRISFYAVNGFDKAHTLTFFEGWITSLSYTFQLYFDFSGYTDMALGLSLLFNIRLPLNFDSPYKATNINEFWHRWHITLSRFLRDYIYIPLGGNRMSTVVTYRNLMLTFLIGGLWHGADWTFLFWGFLHGSAIVLHRLWHQTCIRMNKYLAWFLTFNFVNIAWVFFRAKTWDDATKVLKGMLGLNGIVFPAFLENKLENLVDFNVRFNNPWLLNMQIDDSHYLLPLSIAVSFLICFSRRNSNELTQTFRPTVNYALFMSFLAVTSLVSMNNISEFLYFNF